MKNALSIFLLCLFSLSLAARPKVDTVAVASESMGREVKSVVILPEDYSSRKQYPVVYILHGHTDNYAKWIKEVPALSQLSTQYQQILVCPDGDYNSWYLDSPVDTLSKYETHIVRELIEYIDGHYRTIPDKAHRAITGNSMGGHGAITLAVKHPDVFGAVGSLSGALDLTSLRKPLSLDKKLGPKEIYFTRWMENSAMYLVERLQKQPSLPMFVVCGTEDFLYATNEEFHKKLLELKIPHVYLTSPGKHNWTYWGCWIPHQLQYFSDFFAGRL